MESSPSRLLPILVALLACNGGIDPTSPTSETGTPTPTPPQTSPTATLTSDVVFDPGFQEGPFCAVRSIFEVSCVTGCHSAVVPEAGLDLQTDPYSAIVDVPSKLYTGTLVVPGAANESLLFRKMMNTHGLDQGDVMPPQGMLTPYYLVPVRDWIEGGASPDCVDPGTTLTGTTPTGTGDYHPPGWEAADQHGTAAMYQTGGDCRVCHGADLTGGSSTVTCDDCHAPTWRTDCIWCHGGTLDQTGAPPSDIDDNDDPATISFTSHPKHVQETIHAAYDCVQCHVKPLDILDYGHVVRDITPGFGEIDYTGGLSRIATYYQGTCSNTYCHGTGLVPGEITDGDGPLACGDCHPDRSSPPAQWNAMSGDHALHLGEGIACAECHGAVVDATQTITDPAYHVNGTADVQTAGGVTFDGTTCTGLCHAHNHQNDTW